MINVRKANWEDRDELFELASSEAVRQASFTSGPIEYQNHLSWFEGILHDTDESVFILETNGKFSGQIRFTSDSVSHECKVGISLTEEVRGKNIAVNLFYKSLFLFKKELQSCKMVTAYIKKDNLKSKIFFKKAGFVYSRNIQINDTEAEVWMLFQSDVLIVAEISANHNHNIDIAKKSISSIKECGADAVKIQTYTADTITIDCNNEYFTINQGTLWDGRTLHDLYKEAYTPWEWHDELRDYAESLGLIFFSTPFDFTAVDFLESKKVPIYKIASFEITDIPLIEYAAAKGKPMIISTGIATIGEIQDAVDTCRRVGNNDITLLKCTSSYPAPIDEANLKTMMNLKETFGVKVGLSDHTMGSDVAVAAVALGAEVIEKHFILDRTIGGPDAEFSMEPDDFEAMVKSIRNVEKALGNVTYELSDKIKKSREFSRSLFIVEDVKAGEVLTRDNIRSIRPGYGLAPKYMDQVIGRKALKDLKRGEPLKWEYIDSEKTSKQA